MTAAFHSQQCNAQLDMAPEVPCQRPILSMQQALKLKSSVHFQQTDVVLETADVQPRPLEPQHPACWLRVTLYSITACSQNFLGLLAADLDALFAVRSVSKVRRALSQVNLHTWTLSQAKDSSAH